MNVQVDRTRCENHGQCVIAAPEVFSMDDDGVLVFDPTRVGGHESDVEDAADVCPAQAIMISADR
jgi:ferredoxin